MGKGGGYYVLALNRNKNGMVLDLWSQMGKEAFLDLVKVSDVVIDNFRSSVTERMGIDYESLKKSIPRLSQRQSLDMDLPDHTVPTHHTMILAQALSGMASLCGEPGGKPIQSGAAVADVCAGIFCTYGTIAALYAREQTGL